MKNVLTLVFIAALSGFASCAQDAEPAPDINLPGQPEPPKQPDTTVYYYPSGTVLDHNAMDTANMKRDSVYVINTEEEFLKLYSYKYLYDGVVTDYRPEIDFAQKTVLMAYGNTPGRLFTKISTLERSGDNCTLHVKTINASGITDERSFDWYTAVVVNKINTGVKLNFSNELYLQGDNCINRNEMRRDSVYVINTAEDLEKYCINTDVSQKTVLWASVFYIDGTIFSELTRNKDDYIINISMPVSIAAMPGAPVVIGHIVDKINTPVKSNIKYE